LEAGTTSQPMGPEAMQPAPPAQQEQAPPQMTAWQQQNYGYTQAKTEWSRKAIWAFVLSLAGLMLGILAWIPAIILGMYAYRDTYDDPRLKGRGLAVAALVISLICVVLALVGLAVAGSIR
jgi:hypothetical protein